MVGILIGTYTQRLAHVNGHARGIMQAKLERGALSDVVLAAPMENPSWIIAHPTKPVVYAVSQVSPEGSIVAFADEAKGLRPVVVDSAGGAAPTHAVLHPSGRFLVGTTYLDATVSVWELDQEGMPHDRTAFIHHAGHQADFLYQNTAHVQHVSFDPVTGDLIVVDTGLGEIRWYLFGDGGELTFLPEKTCAMGAAGPRQLLFHPSGNYAFVVNEFDSTLDVLRRESQGPFTIVGTIPTRSPGCVGLNFPAAMCTADDGATILVTNRGDDTVSVFSFDAQKGTVKLESFVASGGACPRDVVVSPDGNWVLVACQDSDLISVFAFDHDSRTLFPVREVSVPTPACLLIREQS